jgi:nitrate/nitrite transporter NarK
MAKQLYKIEIMLHAVEDKEKIDSWTLVESFAVAGGIQRQIWGDLRDNVNQADIMSEFYEARHFKNLSILKLINRSSLAIDRIYYRNLSFSFTFVVTNMSKSSSFKYLVLRAEDGKIPDPPRRDSKWEGLKVTFSNPEIQYHHAGQDGKSVEDTL